MKNTVPVSIPLYEKYAAELARRKEGVHRKIVKVYGFTQEQTSPDTSLEGDLTTAIQDILNGWQWRKRQEDCVTFSHITLTPAQIALLDEAADDIMQNYAIAFFIHSRVNNAVSEHPHYAAYASEHGREGLMDVYINHITIEALSRIQSFGFSNRSTLSMLGFLIRNMAVNYMALVPALGDEAVVRPKLLYGCSSDAEADVQLQLLLNYWREARDGLAAEFKHSPGRG